MDTIDYDLLLIDIEKNTGFRCYEGTPGSQVVFYGTSDKLNAFKTLADDNFNTGTIAYTMDDGGKYMYSSYKDTWYEL